MNTEELRQRLQQMQVGRALTRPQVGLRSEAPASLAAPANQAREALQAAAGESSTALATRAFPSPKTLGELVPGEAYTTAAGCHYRVQRPLDRWFAGLTSTALTGWDGADPQREPHPDLTPLAAAFPRDVIFVDLETCGFAGSQIFLVGMLYCQAGQIVLDQRFARDYREEASILEGFWELAANRPVLASFNGKSFDWPMLCDRTACHRLAESWQFELHADLLHHARRAWKHRLPNCRLKTLEARICRRQRGADIPGSEIPAAYHKFVRDGEPAAIRTILYHNAMDLITLAELTWHLTAAVASQLQPQSIAG